jgi:hypothetical protein
MDELKMVTGKVFITWCYIHVLLSNKIIIMKTKCIITSFTDECHERSNPGSRANHDDRSITITRQPELWIMTDEHRTGLIDCHTIL